MNSRNRKRWIYARFRLRGKRLWLTAEERAWLNVVPVGREFGSKDYERLSILDAYTQGRINEERALSLLGIDRDALAAMVENEGLPNVDEPEPDDPALRDQNDVTDLKGMFGKAVKTVPIDDMNPYMRKP